MKAVLVIDVNDDENIEELRVSYKIDCDGEVLYAANDETLKRLPYKMEQVYGGEDGSEELYDEKYMAGWNACLNKIQKNNGI